MALSINEHRMSPGLLLSLDLAGRSDQGPTPVEFGDNLAPARHCPKLPEPSRRPCAESRRHCCGCRKRRMFSPMNVDLASICQDRQ